MHTNRLAGEKSPYLLQHAHNPVDWYPWGEEAFAKARSEDRPIFLSVGYSTCHWCHVMERESFESEEVAAVLNRYFVPVKVDREERPDVDRIYMAFVQATTQGGGWPMSVWLTPDLKPFYGGTYFAPDDRYGRPGFRQVLEHIAQAWLGDRARIAQSGSDMLEELRRASAVESGGSNWLDSAVFDSCFQVFRRTFDSAHGGFGRAPKFPRPVAFDFLLRHHVLSGNREALDMSLHTLREMAKGGMHDHLGGGFHRYSVDERWFVPHFEKMLYDQAQLAVSYLEAFQITRADDLARVARGVFEYVLRDLTHPDGGFYSAEDADSVINPEHPGEKGEGAFYVWSRAEIASALGSDADWFCAHFGVREGGNVDNDPHGEFTGRNILFEFEPLADAMRVAFESARGRLLRARALRVRPHLDDKVLAGWNGMMISAFALGARALGEPRYLDAAARAAGFVLERLCDASTNRLLRRFRGGEAAIPGMLDDYALFGSALVDLYETSFEGRYLDAARGLASTLLAEFEDREKGGFYSNDGADRSLVLRMKDDYDGAEPSGNSAAALLLVRLAAMTGERRFGEAAGRAFQAFAPRLRNAPHATPRMVVAYRESIGKARQIVFAGADRGALVAEAHRRFLPGTVLLDSAHAPSPMPEVDGRAAAYVCEDFACRLPVTAAEDLARLLE
jgi:uncharacterized protein YyaL (SSP411 family)